MSRRARPQSSLTRYGTTAPPPERGPFAAYKDWAELKRDVAERELNQYNVHINLVERYGEPKESPELLGMIAQFKAVLLRASQ